MFVFVLPYGEFRFKLFYGCSTLYFVCLCVGLMTHDMGLDTPLALDQDRRCQILEAVQNTAEEDPHRAYCGDTVRKRKTD